MFSDDFKMFVNGRPHRSADMTMYYSGQAVGKSASVCMCTPCVCMYVHRHVFVVKAVMVYYCKVAKSLMSVREYVCCVTAAVTCTYI